MPKVFLAGATGYTGRTLLSLPESDSIEWRLHLRPDSSARAEFEKDSRATVAPFEDTDTLAKTMEGCDAVLSLIGTVRARFEPGVNYQTVDYGTTVALVEAAKKAGIGHFVLMSSIGTGSMPGSYLAWKKKAEKVVIDSGIPYTIFRPSYLHGGERKLFPGADGFMKGLAAIPGLTGVADDWRPVPIEVVAWNYLRVLKNGSEKNSILTGRDLWEAYRNKKG